MPSLIKIKRSDTPAAVPPTLEYGELAVNYADGKLYYKNANGDIVSLTANSGLNAKLDALTFNGATTTFNLTSGGVAVTPANANCLLISLNGVIQEPGVSFTLSGSQITFNVAPATSDAFFGVHLTGGAVGGGGGSAGGDAVTNTPAQITSNQNDYALPTADIVRLSSDATRTITGFAADPGAVVTLYNVGSFDIRIDHEDTASTAANRVTSATGADIVLSPNDSITLVYDATSSRWRTGGVVKTTVTGQAAVYEFFRNSAPPDATGSLGSWTWTPPAGVKVMELAIISGGGGGGSGQRGAAGTTRSGGGGGGCSGIANFVVNATTLPTLTASVVVGAGGAGGAAVIADNTNGNTGASGGTSSVTFGVYRFLVGPGRGQQSGATTASAPGALSSNASGVSFQFFGEAGYAGGVGVAGVSNTSGPNQNNQLRSGAGGGGINASNTAFAGGSGGLPGSANYGGDTTATATTAGAAGGGHGGNATFAVLPMSAGGSGAGGGGHASGIGGSGGNGAIGGGGGGGGASVNGFASGNGGNGGDGYVRITVWF
jgi:hypothetical protein